MPQSQNDFLATLSPGDFSIIRPHLKSVELAHQVMLYRTGQPLDRVYFPVSAVISLVVGFANGQMAEVAMVGRDGLVGGGAGMGVKVSLNDATVQIPGSAFLLDAAKLKAAAEAHPSFREALFRREQLVLLQAQQSAACNGTHLVEKRLARWLLRSRDLAMTDALPLTQEFLAQMLAVRRTSVTLTASSLQRAGLIKYRRGKLQILDALGLAELACECHQTLKSHSEALLGIVPAQSPPVAVSGFAP
jgi:CRP-like cAMP-binding protein